MTYDDYKLLRTELRGYVDCQSDIVSAVGYDEAAKGSELPSQQLKEEQERLKIENLCVLVMGKFSSGKSAFLNALFGQQFLGTSAVPKTAVIGEISYSDKEDITLYPKKGKWKGGDRPFKIKKEDLDKYTSIDHTSKEETETPFDKVVIHYPLSICKNGIMLVDSPGLDDPTCNDRITKEYLPKADTIIYCMAASQAYSALDADIINNLRTSGYTSIIFVITYWDTIKKNDELLGTNEAETLSKHLIDALSPLTELKSEGIFFVSSIDALIGKRNNKPELLESSGFPELETKVEKILVDQKGRMKLIRALAAARTINRNIGYYLNDTVTVLQKNRQELTHNLANAQQALRSAKEKADLINQQIESGISNVCKTAKDRAMLFMSDSLISKVPMWVEECNPESGINILKPKKSAGEFCNAILEHIKSKMTSEMERWCKNVLSEDVIVPRMESLLSKQKDNIKQFNNDLSKIRITLDLPTTGEEISDSESASGWSRIAAAAGSLLIGDIGGAIIGGQLGIKAMLTTLAAEVAAGIVVGIVSMFTPVGWVGVIIAAITGMITGGITNIFNLKKQMKKKIAEKTVEELTKQKDKFGNDVETKVNSALSVIRKKLSDQLNLPVNEAQKIVSGAQQALNNGTDKEETIKIFKENIPLNKTLGDKMDNFFNKIM